MSQKTVSGTGKQLGSMRVNTERFEKWLMQTYLPKVRKEATPQAIRGIALELLRHVVQLMPVDTGRARAGWGIAAEFLGLDLPPLPNVSARGEPIGAADVYDPTQGWKQGEAAMTTKSTSTIGIRLVNNVEYVSDLEDGSSQQAPYGMVRLAMRQMQGKVPDGILDHYNSLWGGEEVFTRGGRNLRRSERVTWG